MKKSCLAFFGLLVGLGLVIGGVPWVCAQEEETEEFTLEEVTVTAQKREENQQKVPVAMEVISAEEIKELGKNDIDEILYGISNAIVEKAQDGYRVTIRGITDNSESRSGQSMAPPAVAINMDGVYSNRKDTGMGLFDIERVEVLYGPQSTMYSSNSPGGIINVVTAQPKIDKYEVSGSLEYGSYSLLHTEGAVNAPISDSVAVRAAFTTSVRDAYLTTGADNEDSKAARLRTLFQPNEKISFTVTGEFNRDQGTGFGGGVQAFGDESEVDNPWTGNPSDTKASSDQMSKKAYGQMEWETGLGTLTLTPSYSTRDGDSTQVWTDFMTGQESVKYYKNVANEKGIEAKIIEPSDFPFKFTIGATYYRSEDSQREDSEEYLETGVGSWMTRVMTNLNRAIYANVTYPVMDRFRVTGGLRTSWDEMISDNEEVRGALPGGPLPPGTLEYALEHSEQSTGGSPDYKIGVEYDLNENSMLYADYSTSYRVRGMGGGGGGGPGGPPGGAPAPAGYEGAGSRSTNDPEKLMAYTLGAKNRFFGNKLQVNAAAYYYDYRNYMAGGNDVQAWLWDYTNNVPGTPPNNIMETGEYWREPYANGTGDGRMIGFDLSTSAIITPKDTLDLSVSYIHSEWTDLSMIYYYQWTLVLVETPTPHTEWVYTPGENFNGESMMSTPPWNINLTYNHTFNLPNGGTLRATLISKYKTSFSLSWRESDYPMNYQEAYHIEDVNAVYSHPDGKWSLSAYMKNISNYAEKRMIMNAGGAKLLSIGNPRTYGAVLSLSF